MGITGDHFVTTYEGHTIELISNAWIKRIKLVIDGETVASASIMLPRDVELKAVLMHAGAPRTVIARSKSKFPFRAESIEIDGKTAPLTRRK